MEPKVSDKAEGGLAGMGIPPAAIKMVALWAICMAAVFYAYRLVISDLWSIWMTNQNFSHGVLVGPFALYLVWRKRDKLAELKAKPAYFGLLLIAAAGVLRVIGTLHYYHSLEYLSLVVAIWGVTLTLLGWRLCKEIVVPMLFLLLMVPPPNQVMTAITFPLQRLAAKGSAFILSLLGWNAITEGNIIRLPGQALDVAEACNGLRMLFAILTLGLAMAYLARRPLWERLTVAVSTIVIGLAANIIRIVATGAITQASGGTLSTDAVHDWAGWLMMPMALILLWAEQHFLKELFIDDPAMARLKKERDSVWEARIFRKTGAFFMKIVKIIIKPLPRIAPKFAVVFAIAAVTSTYFWYSAVAADVDAILGGNLPLRAPLNEIPLNLGDWEGKDTPLDEAIIKVAAADDHINRHYVNSITGEVLKVYACYYGNPRTMVGHYPDVCYPNSGWKKLNNFDTAVASTGTTRTRNYPAQLYWFEKDQITVTVFFTINVGGKYTVNRDLARQRSHKAVTRENRNYVAQVQVMIPRGVQAREARDIVAEFYGKFMPALEKCLPDKNAERTTSTENASET